MEKDALQLPPTAKPIRWFRRQRHEQQASALCRFRCGRKAAVEESIFPAFSPFSQKRPTAAVLQTFWAAWMSFCRIYCGLDISLTDILISL